MAHKRPVVHVHLHNSIYPPFLKERDDYTNRMFWEEAEGGALFPPCPPGALNITFMGGNFEASGRRGLLFNQAPVEAAGLDRKEPSQAHTHTDDLWSFMKDQQARRWLV